MSIRRLIEQWIPRGKLSKGVAKIASGAAASQLIVAASAPILTRLYSPEEFGLLAVFSALLALLTIIASLRYYVAIPLPRSDGSAANVVALSFGVLVLFVVIVGALSFVFGQQIGALTHAPQLLPYLWLLPIGVALAGTYQIYMYWAMRHGDFGTIARTKVQQSSGMALTQVGLGAVGAGPIGLIIGQIVGQAAGLFRLALNAHRGYRSAFRRVRIARILQRARRYKDFPLFLSWAGLMNKAGSQLPLILFSAIFSPAMAGLYLLAYRLTSRPSGLVSQSIRQVLFSGAAIARREGRLEPLVSRAFRGLLQIGFAPFLMLAVIAPELFMLVFGPEWEESGTFVQLMTPWLLASFVVSPLTTLTVVMERQRFGLIFQAALLTGKLGGMFLGVAVGGPAAAIAGYSIAACMVYSIFGAWTASAAGVSLRRLGLEVLAEAAVVIPVAAALYFSKSAIDMTLWTILFVVTAIALIWMRSVRPLRRVRSRKDGRDDGV